MTYLPQRKFLPANRAYLTKLFLLDRGVSYRFLKSGFILHYIGSGGFFMRRDRTGKSPKKVGKSLILQKN